MGIEIEHGGTLLGTSRLRWENTILKRKLRQAWLAIWSLAAVVVLVCTFAAMIAGGAR